MNDRFWTVIPFGCFFIPCCKPMTMRKKDFRILYNLILQYAYLSPIFAFGKLVWSVKEGHIMTMIFMALTLSSAALCFYALLALLTATSSLLKHYQIHGKFWCIKAIIVVMMTPQIFFNENLKIIKTFPGENETYSYETLSEAWISIVAIVIFTGLSLLFLKFFKPEDALDAMINQKQKSHKASKRHLFMQKVSTEEVEDAEECNHTEITEIELHPSRTNVHTQQGTV